MSIARFLKLLIEESELTQEEFAKIVGTTRYSINQLVNGRRKLTVNMALDIESCTGTSAGLLLMVQLEDDLERARLGI